MVTDNPSPGDTGSVVCTSAPAPPAPAHAPEPSAPSPPTATTVSEAADDGTVNVPSAVKVHVTAAVEARQLAGNAAVAGAAPGPHDDASPPVTKPNESSTCKPARRTVT